MPELENLHGKKLLILGGADLHRELVNTAKKLGVETYVTDFLPLEQAPAKLAADHAWDLNITDVDAIAARCREVGIDGVLNMYYDPCQRPCQAICEKLGLPCFGTREQYAIFTDKQRFLETCVAHGMDVIPQYREEDFAFDNGAIDYPVFVKPSDSRASRGQSVCRSYAEVAPAIALARSESRDGGVVIQHYMENALDFQMTFLMIDGEPYLENVGDFFNGTVEEGLASSFIVSISPAIRENRIPQCVLEKIGGFLKAMKLQNTPVFLQGFLDGDKMRLYDPALRFPACSFELGMKYFEGLDVYAAMIQFALTGSFPSYLRNVTALHRLHGIYGIATRVFLRPGTIREIRGADLIQNDPRKQYALFYHSTGDRIEAWHDIRQCFAMIVYIVRDEADVEKAILDVYRDLQILDENGEDMKIGLFDTPRLWA